MGTELTRDESLARGPTTSGMTRDRLSLLCTNIRSRGMHARVLLRGGRGLKKGSCRSFATSVTRCNEKPIMNRYSRTVTQPKSQGASQAMLYATEGVNTDEDFNKAMVGIASVWYVIFFRSEGDATAEQLPSGMRVTRKLARRFVESGTNHTLCFR